MLCSHLSPPNIAGYMRATCVRVPAPIFDANLGVPSRRGLGLPPQQLTAPLCLKHSSEQPVHSSCRSAGGSAHGVSLHFARTCNVAANTGGRPRPAALAPTSYRCGSVIPPLALYLLVCGSTPPMVADAMRPTSATTAWFPQVTSLLR